jgi:hypothetical protein
MNGRQVVERKPGIEMVVLGAAAERVEEVVGFTVMCQVVGHV